MPANLTPDYERAEEKYRAAVTDDDKLEALRGMYAVIPKHKGTEKLQAELKRKMSHLRRAISLAPHKTADAFHVPKAGAGQIILVGTPNVGKSSIVFKATGAHVKVADYPFTTTLPAPGMAHFEDVLIELVDTPPVTADHIPGGLLGTIRQADIIAIVADGSGDPLDDAQTVLDLLQSRGVQVRTTALHDLDPANPDEHSAVIVVNKMDLAPPDTLNALHDLYAPNIEVFGISAQTGEGLTPWLSRLWQLLSAIRVYTKQPGSPPEMTKPFTLPIGSSVQDLALEIHRDLPERMKFARVWGGHRIAGMQVHRTEELHDKDIVEIHE